MAYLYGLHHFLVPPPNRPEEITLRSVADIGAVGFDVGSEKRNAFAVVLKIDFFRMKSKPRILKKEIANLWDDRFQVFAIGVNYEKIIDISSVVLAMKSIPNIMIDTAQVDISEKLRGEVSDR